VGLVHLRRAPDLLEELPVRENPARVPDQEGKEPELGTGQPDHEHAPPAEIDLEFADPEDHR
jgi:hypothetical protein